MSRPPRVLILNERDLQHPRFGGAEIHVTEIFRRLASRGFEVTLATTWYQGAKQRDQIEGINIWRLGRIRHYYRRAVVTCARETRRDQFDVVVECLNKLPYLSPLYSGVPVLALCHHLFGETAFQQVAWPIAAAVWSLEKLLPVVYRNTPFVTISDSSRDDLIQRGIPADHVRVIYPGFQKPMLSPPGLAERDHRVVYVGRIEPYKQVDILLRAMAALSERFPAAEIVIVGRGDDVPRLEALAAELGLADRTRFTGFVSDEERDRLLGEARVCVFPSTKEGWGLTVIEANALGTPVVATDAPGLRDSVRHGETGYLVPNRDVAGFAERIGSLLSNDELAREMSAAALTWSRQFDWDTAADEMAESLEAARRLR